MKMNNKCQNGCNAEIHPPSKVICKHCQIIITQKFRALTLNIYGSIQWPKFPGDWHIEDLPDLPNLGDFEK